MGRRDRLADVATTRFEQAFSEAFGSFPVTIEQNARKHLSSEAARDGVLRTFAAPCRWSIRYSLEPFAIVAARTEELTRAVDTLDYVFDAASGEDTHWSTPILVAPIAPDAPAYRQDWVPASSVPVVHFGGGASRSERHTSARRPASRSAMDPVAGGGSLVRDLREAGRQRASSPGAMAAGAVPSHRDRRRAHRAGALERGPPAMTFPRGLLSCTLVGVLGFGCDDAPPRPPPPRIARAIVAREHLRAVLPPDWPVGMTWAVEGKAPYNSRNALEEQGGMNAWWAGQNEFRGVENDGGRRPGLGPHSLVGSRL
jgi:hypothetical protein